MFVSTNNLEPIKTDLYQTWYEHHVITGHPLHFIISYPEKCKLPESRDFTYLYYQCLKMVASSVYMQNKMNKHVKITHIMDIIQRQTQILLCACDKLHNSQRSSNIITNIKWKIIKCVRHPSHHAWERWEIYINFSLKTWTDWDMHEREILKFIWKKCGDWINLPQDMEDRWRFC